jgi:GTP cyclohydrolase IA
MKNQIKDMIITQQEIDECGILSQHPNAGRPTLGFVNIEQKHIDGMELIRTGVKNILSGLTTAYGLDISDENFDETPTRVAKMMILERCIGINSYDWCKEILSKSFPKAHDDSRDEMIITANPAITYGICPHHLENVEYRVWMAYMPSDKVVGISKFNRVIDVYARQPILQEDFTSGLATLFEECLDPLGLMIVVKGKHDCMVARGARANPDQWMITSAVRGKFLEEETYKEEFLKLCKFK